jgi:hypothetical protein
MVDSAPKAESCSLVLNNVCGRAGENFEEILDNEKLLSFLDFLCYFSLSVD